MKMFVICAAFFVLFLFTIPAVLSVTRAATYPQGFTESVITSGFNQPTAMAFAPDGRLFVLEKTGRVRVIRDNFLLSAPFVFLPVNTGGNERGLLGITFDPDFTTNRYVYLYYTASAPTIHNRVSRFTMSTMNPDTAQAGSEQVILELETLSATNHNGGSLHFGPDKKLYVATGENAVTSNAQTKTNKLGKILRINPDGSIPSDNPFVSEQGAEGEIWALGLRNPFTFAFETLTGKMFINDVGQSTYEEINAGQKGGNYGWPVCEGTCNTQGFINPLYQYPRSVGQAITGGTIYNANQFPAAYKGKYFFADYLGNWIKMLNPANNQVTDFSANAESPVDLDVGPDGSLYVLSIGSGKVTRISYGTPSPTPNAPTPTLHPTSAKTYIGVNLRLHGIGIGGDNVNASSAGNLNPLRTQRPVTLEFTHADGQTTVKEHAVFYDSFYKEFRNVIDVTGLVSSGPNIIKVTVPQYLTKTYPGIVMINTGVGEARNLLPIALTTGDSNGDNRLNILDYNMILDCYADLGTPRNCGTQEKKDMTDLTDDGNVNQFDYNLFLRELSVQYGDGDILPTSAISPTGIAGSCLSQSGPTRTISGIQTVRFDTRLNTLPDSMKINADTAVWKGVHDYPVIITGGRGICFSGGSIEGTYPTSTTWDVMHGTTAMEARASEMSVENVRVHNYGDAVSFKENSGGFRVKGLHLSYIRDDCIENDWLHTGLIEDSLLDGCYSAFSARTYEGQSPFPDGRNNTWTIRNNLIRLQPMEKIYKDRGLIPGHDGFFKWDPLAPKLSLHNNIFRVDQQANNVGLGLPDGKLVSCSNNTVVWLGSGPYPATLPATLNGQSCFTFTGDKGIWDSAVVRWKQQHGF